MDTLTLGFSVWQLESSCRPSRMRTSGASLIHDDRQQKRYVLTMFPAPTHLHTTNLSQQHPSTPKSCVITRTDPYATTSHNDNSRCRSHIAQNKHSRLAVSKWRWLFITACVWICNDQKDTVRLSTACIHHWPSVFVLTRWGQNEKSATALHHNNIRRWWAGRWQRLWCYAIHTMHTDSPFGFFSTPFARCITALFDLVQRLLACTVWTRTLPFFSSVSHVTFVITTKAQIWTFTPLFERQSPIWEILTPSNLTWQFLVL